MLNKRSLFVVVELFKIFGLVHIDWKAMKATKAKIDQLYFKVQF